MRSLRRRPGRGQRRSQRGARLLLAAAMAAPPSAERAPDQAAPGRADDEATRLKELLYR